MQQLLRSVRRVARCLGTHGPRTCFRVCALAVPTRPAIGSSSSAGAASAAAGPPALVGQGRGLASRANPPPRAPKIAVVDVLVRPARPGSLVVAAAARSSNRGGSASTRGAPAADVEDSALPSFEDLGVSPAILAGLKTLGIETPTEIQAMAIPALSSQPGNYFLASHTGSGKTLAYLVPLVQLLKQQEAEGFVPRPKRPRVLVLGPTKELTEQITRVAKVLCHHAKFRAACVNAYKTVSDQSKQLAGPIDVLVATPTRLLQHIKEGNVFYRDVNWLVIDEADTVFSQGWAAEVAQVLQPLRSKPSPANVLLVSATLTKPIQKVIQEYVPNTKELKTSTLHKAVGGSRHQFLNMPPGSDKLQLLAEVLSADRKNSQKVLVFCSTVDSARAVEHFCKDEGMACVCYHGTMPMDQRQEAMATFAGAADPGTLPGGRLIMIASDLAARGLDFPGTIDHVINFDFPSSSVDYLHRTGRTARAGRTGRITSIVSKKDKVLAQRIQWALEHDEPLDALSSDRTKLPPSQVATRAAARANAREREAAAIAVASGGRRGTGTAKLRRFAAAGARRGRPGAGGGAEGGGGAGAAGGKRAAPPAAGGRGGGKVVMAGPVRGAARRALLQERLKQRNAEKQAAGKARRQGRRGAGAGPGPGAGGPAGRRPAKGGRR